MDQQQRRLVSGLAVVAERAAARPAPPLWRWQTAPATTMATCLGEIRSYPGPAEPRRWLTVRVRRAGFALARLADGDPFPAEQISIEKLLRHRSTGIAMESHLFVRGDAPGLPAGQYFAVCAQRVIGVTLRRPRTRRRHTHQRRRHRRARRRRRPQRCERRRRRRPRRSHLLHPANPKLTHEDRVESGENAGGFG